MLPHKPALGTLCLKIVALLWVMTSQATAAVMVSGSTLEPHPLAGGIIEGLYRWMADLIGLL